MGTAQNTSIAVPVLALKSTSVPVRYFAKYIAITYTGIVFE